MKGDPMRHIKFLLLFLILALLLAALPARAETVGAQYRELKTGMKGYDVYLLRIRLYQLGYLPSDRGTEEYTAKLANTVKLVQEANRLEPTGIATPAFQALLYSEDCVPAASVPPAATSKPTSPASLQSPTAQPELPELDDEGFLERGSTEEFIYENEEDGLWYYISSTLYVEIRRFIQTKPNLKWYETTVNLRDILPTSYSSTYTKLTSDSFTLPDRIAADNHVVLAISDDSYTLRTFGGDRSGIVIRNGTVITNSPYNTFKGPNFPNMDVMAFLPDGSMALFENGETTPEYLLSLGAKDVYSFGPILLKDGRESLQVRYGYTYSSYKHPRCAIGMRSPNHYIVLTVAGRNSFTDGVRLPWLADKMRELGARNAFNLDGGRSTYLVFMGKILNMSEKNALRKITTIIGFGTSDRVEYRGE